MDSKIVEYVNGIIDRIEYARKHRLRNIVCIKYYNLFDVNADELKNILSSRRHECYLRFHSFRKNYMYDACEPVLPWIREIYNTYYNDISPEDFLDRCGVYPLHVKMLCSYFNDGIFRREEQTVVSEVEYEKRQFMKSLVNILDYVSARTDIVFVLSKLHMAPQSVCDFLWEMIESGKCRKLILIAGYNELYRVSPYMQNSWERLIAQIMKHKLQIEWDIKPYSNLSEDEDEVFIPRRINANEYLIKMYNMMCALTLEQAEYYGELVRYFEDLDNTDVEEQTKLYLLITDTYVNIFASNYKNAFYLCEQFRKHPGYAKDMKMQYMYNKLLILTKVYGGQKESSIKNVIRCNELAVKMKDNARIFESHILRCIVELDGWKDVILHEKDINLPADFEENAVRYHWTNHLSYIYFFGFVDDIHMDNSEAAKEYIGCEKSLHFRKGMEIAKKLRNDEAMLNAWKKNIVIANTTGRFEASQYYYDNCLAILKNNNREGDEAQLYNGAGYYYIVREEFEAANNYLKTAIDIFTKIGEPYLACESLYNMAINAMAAGQYEEVEKNIKNVLDTLKLIHKQRIRIANLSKLYGILTLAYIQQGKEYDARLYMDKMTNVLSHILNSDNPDYFMWEDDMFVYYLASAMLAIRDEHFEKAEKMFAEAEKMWRLQPINQFYVFGMFIFEACNYYKKIGNNKEYNRLLNEGLTFFIRTGQKKNYDKLEKRLEGNLYDMGKIGRSLSKEKYDKMIDMVEKYSLREELSEKKRYMNFFENWVELLNGENGSTEVMIERAMSTLENTYNIDKLIYLEIANGRPIVKYCDRNFPVSGYQIKGIVNYFGNNRKSLVVSRFDSDYDKYSELTELFGINDIFSVIGISIDIHNELSNILIAIRTKHKNFTQGIESFTDEELDVFKTTFRQLLDAVSREQIKLQLEKSSVTDLLTGLLNRQGFKKKLDSLFSGYSQMITILYMDLDNFKYCNDHFGHEAGDAVLIAFSRMLEYVAGRDSIISRYGGDEFVIVLPNKDVTDGINVAEGLFKEISFKQGFIQTIREVIGEDVQIEEENRVTCSIGIASDICLNFDEINGIMLKADDALYQVKNTTKSNYEVWQ